MGRESVSDIVGYLKGKSALMIFDRRNKIVHQLDCDHKTGLPTDIQKSDVERYIAAIEQFVKKLYDKLNK